MFHIFTIFNHNWFANVDFLPYFGNKRFISTENDFNDNEMDEKLAQLDYSQSHSFLLAGRPEWMHSLFNSFHSALVIIYALQAKNEINTRGWNTKGKMWTAIAKATRFELYIKIHAKNIDPYLCRIKLISHTNNGWATYELIITTVSNHTALTQTYRNENKKSKGNTHTAKHIL